MTTLQQTLPAGKAEGGANGHTQEQAPRPRMRYAEGWTDQIPAELRERPQWVVWRYEWRVNKAGEGKWTKVPYQPKGRGKSKAQAGEPQTWGTFAAALRVYLANTEWLDGIGYEFHTDDPYTGVDYDHCITPEGELVQWADDKLASLGYSYAETSPSGSGIKAFYRYVLPPNPTSAVEGTGRRLAGYGVDGSGEIEIYDRGRFFTITGNVWWVEHRTVADPDGEAMAALVAEVDAKGKGKKKAPGGGHATDGEPREAAMGTLAVDPHRKATLDQFSDDDLLTWARNARNGGKFSALYDAGDCSGYPSGSEADCGLLVLLAYWTGADAARMERLFDRSALARREKWERPDYRARTIASAIGFNNGASPDLSETSIVFDQETGSIVAESRPKPPPGEPRPPAAEANGTLTVEPDDGTDVEIIDRWPKLDPIAFHGVAGEIVAAAEPHTEADPVAILIQFLVAFGNMIGRGPHFVVGPTRHYLNMFVTIVGMTALGRKGTSWDVVKWTIEGVDRHWATNRIQSGLISGEGLIHHVRDEVREEKELTDGRKVEVVVDEGVKDKRLLVEETELSRPLKAMNRESNTLSDVIRQAWDAGNLQTLAKHSKTRATGAHISIIGHTTQSDIRKHLTETDTANGFANRFLWAVVRRSKMLPDGGNISSVNWTPIHNKMCQVTSHARSVGRMVRDQGAAKMWAAVYPELSEGKSGMLGAVLSRGVPQTLRLACLYALLDGSAIVREEHLEAAIALWEFCEQSARTVFGESNGDPAVDKLLAALKADPEGLTRKAISVDVFKKNKSSKALTALLSDLLTQGLIHKRAENDTGGRPAERWFSGREGVVRAK